MKATLAAIFLVCSTFAFTGCETDVPPNPDTQRRLDKGVGIVGDGALVQPDNTGDPLINENTRVGY